MSILSDIYDEIVSVLETNYPDHNKLTNPYSIEENNEQALRQGYGLAVGPSQNTQRFTGCKMSIAREFRVIFTRQVYALEQDIDAKQEADKQLMEDQRLLIKEIEKDPQLDVGSNGLTKFVFTEDTGIEYVHPEKQSFIKLETIFIMEYIENLT